MNSGWIGVDLDGTLATHLHNKGLEIGPPVPDMLERVKMWLANGWEVRIVTARVAACARTNADGVVDSADFAAEQTRLIQAWLLEHLGQSLEVTAQKDFMMVQLWDDRAVAVEENTGRILGGKVFDEDF